MANIHRYTGLKPRELAARLDAYPVAIIPWGALEWHGPHLPFGLDGLVAEGFGQRLAAATGAVLLPTYYLPITSLPHPHSLSTKPEIVAALWEDLFGELSSAGFDLLCLISGHYAQGHEWVLAEVAERFSEGSPTWVLAGSPLSLLDDPELLDHAGRYETGQLLALHPELVDLDRLPNHDVAEVDKSAVLGQDPRRASAEEGEQLIRRGLRAWQDWIARLLAASDPTDLVDLYRTRRASYQDYVDRFYDGSWERAIEAWWRQATS